MQHRMVFLIFIIGLWSVAGCAGQSNAANGASKRDGIYVRVVELSRDGTTAEPAQRQWKVAVAPFIDRRSERSRVGTHTSIIGSTTPIYARDANPAMMMTLLVIDALKRQKGWDVWLDRPGVAMPEGGPNVRLTGEILECEVNARPSFFATTITAGVKLVMHAWNSADGSTAEMRIEQDGRDWQFWFDPDDAEAQFNTTLHASLTQLVSRAAINNQLFGFSSDQHGDHQAALVPNTDTSSTSHKKGNP